MLVNVSCEEDVSPSSSSPSPTPPHCPLFWDGFLCWPRTRAGSLAALSCFEELLGVQYDTTQNATLQCQADGSWSNHSDYSRCVERSGAEMTEPAGADSTEVTSLIYLLGYSLSLGALLLAVAVFLYFKDLRCLRNTIHTNLMCTYILFALIWILNLTLQLQVQGSDLSCLLLVIFSHYFLLTNFFWMLVEGLYLYMLVVKTFAGENITLKVYASIGWGAPALFVVTWTVARTLVTIQPDSGELNELSLDKRRGVCLWMREHAVDWIYIGPGVVALVLNLLFLVRVMWVLITKLRSANTLETQRSRKAAKALLVLIPLLGLTYLLVLWGPTHPLIEDIFEHVKATLLSTQGFTVALFYCFLNTEVQNALRHHVGRWQDKRSVQGGRRYTYNYNKDWSPRSRTESLRLYSQPASGYHKRESCTSEVTTSTLVALPAAPTVPNHAETQGEVVCGGSD